MLIIIKFLAKVLSALNSEISPKQIAAGFAYGVLLGLVPAKGALSIFLLIIGFILNINLALMSVAAVVFKIGSFAIDPLANRIGYFLLTGVPSLKGFWTTLYNLPVVPYTRFNNTLVLGSFLLGLLFLVPAYFIGQWGVVAYRTRLREKIMEFKIIQIVKTSSLYRYYESFRGITGE